MNQFVQNMTGMGPMTDQVVATDMLIAAKAGIKNIATAISESATPEVRAALQQQLDQQIRFHGQMTEYMMKNGYYHPYNMEEQVRVDLAAANTALSQANQGQQMQQ
ncbi:spore coat protein [Halalkalibacterium halodurans]|jgi:similar to spore coat protein|uniref:Spore coat protein n=2 Tax=Halalkalibacterium halodurans TaxID=86665 RepID=Q9KEV6_HALH5|nr:spore coat protein [Halalkalibacterium halodurans]MDY7221248.1 spore coat protein [Halalkalibacterium halodurans]MDY7240487.1 spore coat protein [Halalkalibacterium halodurans]MED4080369.1 spore coat protein [Halalkalibacterium halodurans]MED4084567.1 spore coat protein [Halalkalibacterium halodurans]MED4104869.1 spore coat protein [Halalkalibacterium halodurans]